MTKIFPHSAFSPSPTNRFCQIPSVRKKSPRLELTPPSNVRKSRLKEGGRPRPPANASRNHRAASSFPFSSHCPPPPAPSFFLSAFQHLPSAMPVCGCASSFKFAIALTAFSHSEFLLLPASLHFSVSAFQLFSVSPPSLRSLSRCYQAIFPTRLNCNFKGLTPNTWSSSTGSYDPTS